MGIKLSEHFNIDETEFTDEELAKGFLALYGIEEIDSLKNEEFKKIVKDVYERTNQ